MASNFLIDCGWNNHFDPSLLQPLSRVASTVDAILLSYLDTLHLGALPYTIKQLTRRLSHVAVPILRPVREAEKRYKAELRTFVGLVEPVTAALVCILIPGMLEDGDATVDQTLVFVRQEKREGDEDQSQEEVFGGGYFFAAEVEKEEEGDENEGFRAATILAIWLALPGTGRRSLGYSWISHCSASNPTGSVELFLTSSTASSCCSSSI
ncbi:hypothetical protein ACFX1X_038783 [Malus domestica]